MLRWGRKDMYVDLGAERLLAAEKGIRRIAVETKSFRSRSELDDLEKALGQYILYRAVLQRVDPERELWLAIAREIKEDVFEEPIGEILLNDLSVRLAVFDPAQEVLLQWIK